MTWATIATIAASLAGAFPGAGAQTPSALNTAPVDTQSRLAVPFIKPIVISSLGNYFSVVGRFVGKVMVFEDSIAVELDTLFASRVHHGFVHALSPRQ